MRSFSSLLALSPLLLSPFTQALDTIEVLGQEWINSATGERFDIIGVDYQPGGSAGYKPTTGKDVLSNATVCLRDAAMMQLLGVNTIRVYQVDPYIDHNECVSIFNYAGIYLLLDVNSPLADQSIDDLDPSSSYDEVYLNRTFAVLDAFREFPNTLGFISANELIYETDTAELDPSYLRAVTRDLKEYLQARGGRQVPVGYSAADVSDTLESVFNYVQCALNGDTAEDYITYGRSDFFGLNDYTWCGDSTYVESGYSVLTEDFKNSTIPFFFSEYGCNLVTPRTFTEVEAIYGEEMRWMSGGLVYQYTEETNGYGLVTVATDGSLTVSQDYDNLQTQLNTINLSIIETAESNTTDLTPPACNAALINDASSFQTGFALPTQPPGVSSLIKSGAPGASTGTLVSVTSTVITINVTPVSGDVTSSLSITSAGSAGNTPSGATGSATATVSATTTESVSADSTATADSTGTASSSSSSSSTSKAGAAMITGAPAIVGAGMAGALFMMI